MLRRVRGRAPRRRVPGGANNLTVRARRAIRQVDFALDEVAAAVGGVVVGGGPRVRLSGFATLEEAGPSELSFFASPKYRSQFERTRAGAVLVTPEVRSGPGGVALIQVDNPSYALAVLARKASEAMRVFEAGVDPAAHVSAEAQVDVTASVRCGAVVEAGAVVGARSEVGSGVIVGRGVRIGSDCVLHPGAVVREGCVLGDRVILQPGAVIGSDGYGYEFAGGRHQKVPQLGVVVLEDDVEVGANSCVDRARFGKTVVGEGTKIDNLVQVGHNVRIGKHGLLVAQAGVAGSAKLGDFVTLAAKSGVNGHIELADGVKTAGGTKVFRSITEPGAVYFGTPARPVKEQLRLQRAQGELAELVRTVKALRREMDELKG